MFADAIEKVSRFTRPYIRFGKGLLTSLSYPVRQGDFLCRLGFPFPEFSNFSYDQKTDEIEWTDKGSPGSPMFPVEGMVTRFMGQNGVKFGIEMSPPGI